MDNAKKHTYIVVDPNKPGALLWILQRILIEKLSALPLEDPTA